MGGGAAKGGARGGAAGAGGAFQDLSVYIRGVYTLVSRDPDYPQNRDFDIQWGAWEGG